MESHTSNQEESKQISQIPWKSVITAAVTAGLFMILFLFGRIRVSNIYMTLREQLIWFSLVSLIGAIAGIITAYLVNRFSNRRDLMAGVVSGILSGFLLTIILVLIFFLLFIGYDG